MRVNEYMTAPVVVMAPSEPISRARNLMLKHDIGTIVVVEGDEPLGIVTRGDITDRLNTQGPAWRRRPIDRVPVDLVMTRGLITIYPGATVQQAAELLVENDIGALPVVENGNLIGIIAREDVAEAFIDMNLGLKARDIMMTRVAKVHRHHTLAHVKEVMSEEDTHWVVVMEGDGTPVGLIDTHHLALVKQEDERGDLPLKGIEMTRKIEYGGERRARYVVEAPLVAEDVMLEFFSVSADEDAGRAVRIMLDEDVNAVPVANEEIVGIVTKKTILRTVMERGVK